MWAAGSQQSDDAQPPSSVTVGAVAHRASATDHNSADVDFALSMTPHHTQAIEVAHDELTAGRGAAALGLATSVQVTQQAEVGQLRTMLRQLSR